MGLSSQSICIQKRQNRFYFQKNIWISPTLPWQAARERSIRVRAGCSWSSTRSLAHLHTITFLTNLISSSAGGFSEDAEGNIYCGTYPRVHLYKFDPVAKELSDYGRMDDTQNYMGTVCPGNDGWVYMGIGTEKNNIVAFNLSTGERRNLVPETIRQKGSGHVYKGTDGEIYGTFLGEIHNGGEINDTDWKLLRNGECFDAEFESLPKSYLHNGVFATIHDPFLYNSILHYSLTDCELTYIHPDTKETVDMIIEYTNEGASLSPLTSDNCGKI